MSESVVKWAIAQRCNDSIEKLVLCVSGFLADDDGFLDIDLRNIAVLCNCPQKHVERAFKRLELQNKLQIKNVNGRCRLMCAPDRLGDES